ncbi:glutaminase A [Auritidibacter sp. NML100628]|uniref:glutaminase A n=1 Tax=Auritidibacter sp. NML100628 TaxID=2170742 RepID=UPI000D738207|nr:glutaminase A [Auritidibacter sp. NML100628]PXA76267.1 glutaminase A [Auritidibacter sp. NML100628]
MRSPLQDYLEQLVTDLRPMRHGAVNPVTDSVVNPNPDHLSITLTTVNGQQYSAGDVDQRFAIQSIAKVFAYALALDDLGPQKVGEKVDVEPSGDSFNEISLQSGTGRPDNPMINAGAIATVGLIKGRGGRNRIGRLMHAFEEASAGCDRELKIMEQIYRAENKHGHRNRALAWLLRSFDIIESDPEPIVDDYFRQCAVGLTSAELSMMAATLARRGENPVTGRQVFTPETVRQVVSVMNTCGMYDSAGNWAIDVGLPAKSGVDGGIMVVLPGQLGIGVFSPPLDEHGTSVRGAAAIARITSDLGLHYADAPPLGRSTLRAHYSLADAFSGVIRSTDLSRAVSAYGHRCQILEISGDLGFAETEALQRSIVEFDDDVSTIMIDLNGIDEFGRSAIRVLASLASKLNADNRDLAIIDHEDRLVDHIMDFVNSTEGLDVEDPREKAKAASEGELVLSDGPRSASSNAEVQGTFRLFENRAAALEWAEHRLAQRYAQDNLPASSEEPESAPLFEFLDDRDVDVLAAIMERRKYKAGEIIRRAGQPFGGIYFIRSGRVETTSHGSGGARYRQTYLSPGTTFGEIALGRSGRQVSTIRAVDDVVCLVLTAQMIASVEETDPNLAIKLWTALTREAYTVLEQSAREAGAREEFAD